MKHFYNIFVVRKYAFIKNYIMRNKSFFGVQAIELVSSEGKGITKKNTPTGYRFKFGSFVRKFKSIITTSNNSKMKIGWWSRKLHLKWCLT